MWMRLCSPIHTAHGAVRRANPDSAQVPAQPCWQQTLQAWPGPSQQMRGGTLERSLPPPFVRVDERRMRVSLDSARLCVADGLCLSQAPCCDQLVGRLYLAELAGSWPAATRPAPVLRAGLACSSSPVAETLDQGDAADGPSLAHRAGGPGMGGRKPPSRAELNG